MTPKQWKRLFARIILWAGLSIGVVLLVFLALATWRIYGKEREASFQHKDAVQALSELGERKVALTEDLKNLETSRGIEEEVRKRYPVAKPGEEEIRLISPKSAPKATSTPTEAFWKGFFGWFHW
ncbi:MAG: hypothetical protein V4449_01875 [Patescibacteria group bacterium]